MATPVQPSVGAGAPGSLLWSSGSTTVDEALNQREFEAARQNWLNPDQTKKSKPVVATKTKSAQLADKKVLDRADRLMQESARMEARLALLRQTMEVEKQKRSNPKAVPLSPTVKLGGGVNYKNVAPRIDTQNTFLNIKLSNEREAKQQAERKARAEKAEAQRLANLRAQGHTLVTYAPVEEQHKWQIHHEEEEHVVQARAVESVGLAVRGASSLPVATATSASRSGIVPRKTVTAADVMRTRRQGSAGKTVNNPITSTTVSRIPPKPTASLPAPISASVAYPTKTTSDSSTTIDRSQFNLIPQSSGISSSASSSLLDGEYDESSNAAEFAAARQEFLQSLQSSASVIPGTESESASDTHISTSSSTIASGLPSNWWEQEEESSKYAAPGSLLDGPSFDEQDSANAFQAARQQWIQENQENSIHSTPIASTTSKPTPSATAAVTTTKVASSNPSCTTVAPSTTAPTAAAGGPKSSCYNCYKLFYVSSGVFDSETQKSFCTNACAYATRSEMKETCLSCLKKVKRKDAQLEDQGWICLKCSSTMKHTSGTDTSSIDKPPPPKDEPLISLFDHDTFAASLATMQPIMQQALTNKPTHAHITHASTHHQQLASALDKQESGQIGAWNDDQ